MLRCRAKGESMSTGPISGQVANVIMLSVIIASLRNINWEDVCKLNGRMQDLPALNKAQQELISRMEENLTYAKKVVS